MYIKITIALWLLITISYSASISCNTEVTGTTIGAPSEAVQFDFRMSTNFTRVTFSTCNDETQWDTNLNLQTIKGTGATNPDLMDDDSCDSTLWRSILTITLADISYGTQYYIEINSNYYASGPFRLTAVCDSNYVIPPTQSPVIPSPTSSPEITTTMMYTTVDLVVGCNETVIGNIGAWEHLYYRFTLPSEYAAVTFDSCITDNEVDTKFTLVDGNDWQASRVCNTYGICTDEDAGNTRCPSHTVAAILEIPVGEISTDTEYYLDVYGWGSGQYAFDVKCYPPPPTYIQNITCGDIINQTIDEPASAYYYYEFQFISASENQYKKALFTTCFPWTTEDLMITVYDQNFNELFTSLGSVTRCPYGSYAPTLILDENNVMVDTIYYIAVNYKFSGAASDYFGLGVTCFDDSSNVPVNTAGASDLTCGGFTAKTSGDAEQQVFSYSFTFPAGYDRVSISTCNLEGPHNLNHDTRVVIYDSMSTKLAENDDNNCSYFDGASTLTFDKTSETQYYISVSYFAYPDFTNDFDFILSTGCYGNGYPDIIAEQISSISCGENIEGAITNANPFSYYELILDNDYDRLIFSTCDSKTSLQSVITIYDSNWQILDENIDADNGCSFNSNASTVIYQDIDSMLFNQSVYYISVTPEAAPDGLFTLSAYCLSDVADNKLDLAGKTVTNITCGTNIMPSMSGEILYYAFQPPTDYNEYDQILFSTCNAHGYTDITDTKITVYDSNFTIRTPDLYTDDNNCAQAYILPGTDAAIDGNFTRYYLTATYIGYPTVPVDGNIGISTSCWDFNDNVPNLFPPIDYCTRVDDETNTCYIDKDDSSVAFDGIYCPSQYENCVVTCGPGYDACRDLDGASVSCPSTGSECKMCVVDCTGDSACEYLKIRGNDCELLYVHLEEDYQDYMNIIAPGNGGTLIVNGSDARFTDFEYANVTSVMGTMNMVFNLRNSYSRYNNINGEYVTNNFVYTCGGGQRDSQCRGTDITCPNDATCLINCIDECSSNLYPFIVRAIEGTHDVDWICPDEDNNACQGALLKCYGNDSMWSIETGWDHNGSLWMYDTLAGPGCTDLPTVQPTPAPSHSPTQFTDTPTPAPTTGAPTQYTETPTAAPSSVFGFCDEEHDQNTYIGFPPGQEKKCRACVCEDDVSTGWYWGCMFPEDWDSATDIQKRRFLKKCPLTDASGSECKDVGLMNPSKDIENCLCGAFKCKDDAETANIIGVGKVIVFVIGIILCI